MNPLIRGSWYRKNNSYSEPKKILTTALNYNGKKGKRFNSKFWFMNTFGDFDEIKMNQSSRGRTNEFTIKSQNNFEVVYVCFFKFTLSLYKNIEHDTLTQSIQLMFSCLKNICHHQHLKKKSVKVHGVEPLARQVRIFFNFLPLPNQPIMNRL